MEKCNSNGLVALKTCSSTSFWITTAVYRLPNHNKPSWMHPCSKPWYLIYYVIVSRGNRQDVRMKKTMCGSQNSKYTFSPGGTHKGRRWTSGSMSASQNSTPDSKLSELDLRANGEENEWVTFSDTVYHITFYHSGRNTEIHGNSKTGLMRMTKKSQSANF